MYSNELYDSHTDTDSICFTNLIMTIGKIKEGYQLRLHKRRCKFSLDLRDCQTRTHYNE